MSVVIGEINDFRMIIIAGVWDCWQNPPKNPKPDEKSTRHHTEWDKLDGKWIANDIIKSFSSFLWRSIKWWAFDLCVCGFIMWWKVDGTNEGLEQDYLVGFGLNPWDFCVRLIWISGATLRSTWATLCLATIIPWKPPVLDFPETSSIIDSPFPKKLPAPVEGKTLKWPKLSPYTTHKHTWYSVPPSSLIYNYFLRKLPTSTPTGINNAPKSSIISPSHILFRPCASVTGRKVHPQLLSFLVIVSA